MALLIDQQTVNNFQNDGVTVLRGLFSEWIAELRAGVDLNMSEPNPDARIYQNDQAGGRFFVDYCSWQRIPQYREFIYKSPIARIAAQLMLSDKVQLFHEHVLVKEPQTNIATPWHHDMPYYCASGPKTISLWLPLDGVPRERTLEFIAGSHLWGKHYRPQRFNGQPVNENDNLEDIPNIDSHRENYNIVGWDLEPGDAVAFDYRTIHGAPANLSNTSQRRAFSLRLLGDGAHFVRREGLTTSPPFNQVTLQDGDDLSGEEFPILYEKYK